jgi:hypothetical protein
MGRYHTLMAECEIAPIESPTLFLRAADPLPHQAEGPDGDGSAEGGWRPSWPFRHTLATTPGDHFTIMEDNIAVTTEAIERWLADQGI